MSVPLKRWPAWSKEQQLAAVSLLAVWYFEMKTDAQDGEYDCTCCPGDACPMHRAYRFLQEVGVRGIGRPPSKKRMLGGAS